MSDTPAKAQAVPAEPVEPLDTDLGIEEVQVEFDEPEASDSLSAPTTAEDFEAEFGVDDTATEAGDDAAETPREEKPKSKTKKAAAPKLPARRGAPAAKGAARRDPPPIVMENASSNVHAARPRETVNLDQRKLTKKQKTQLEHWRGSNRGKVVDSYFAGTAAVARQQFGAESIYVGSATQNLMIGIPIPSLAFEYLLAQDCFPLGHILQVNGPPGTNKTSLMAEFIRWFVLNGGGANYLEAETKQSPDLLPSIIGWDRNPYIIDRCDTLEEWQRRMTFYIDQHKKRLTGTEKEPGPGRTVPILIGVDSLMGKLSEETIEKIKEAGSAGRQFPKEALSLTSYFKTVPAWIDQWPFAIVLNNHVKFSKDEQGNKQRNKGGGQQISFQESFELEMSVVKTELKCAEWDGKVLQIRNYKNSFGPDQRRIQVRIIWWHEPDPNAVEEGGIRQVTRWDWDWATTRMLFDVLKGGGKLADRLKNVMHFATPSTAEITGTAYSTTLKMKAEDAVSWAEFGAMINANAKLKDAIRDALLIKRRPWLAGDYVHQLEDLAKKLP